MNSMNKNCLKKFKSSESSREVHNSSPTKTGRAENIKSDQLRTHL